MTEAITEMGEVIEQINDFTTTIAAAVEQQSATTAEMARSVAEAASSTVQIARSMSGVADAAGDHVGVAGREPASPPTAWRP